MFPRRLRLASIRARLTAWVAFVLLAAACVSFLVVYGATGRQLRGQIERDLHTDNDQAAQSLRLLAGRPPVAIAAAARGYLGAQPYRTTSTLLFVTVAGAGTVSNHPELFAAPRLERGETAGEQERENASARSLLTPRNGLWTGELPDVGAVRVLELHAMVGRVPVVIGAGEPLAIVARSQRAVVSAFLLAGALTLLLAMVASYLAGARVSAPLRRMTGVAARVDEGDLAPRMRVQPGGDEEVRVLAESFNHMLDRLALAFARQQEFVADASHELRTPLTVIAGQLEVLAAQTAPPQMEVRRVEQLVRTEVRRMERLVDDLLLLAQSEQPGFLRCQELDLEEFVSQLWEGFVASTPRRCELGAGPHGRLQADPDRLAQALRNLLRNAVEHTASAHGLVRLDVEPAGAGRIRFCVSDDGPGVPPQERERIFARFHRTRDGGARASGGAGLGLAIVKAIAEAHGGSVRVVDTATDGHGARFELTLGGFDARRPTSVRPPASRAGTGRW